MPPGQSINDATLFHALLKGAFPLDEDHPDAVGDVTTAYYSFMQKDGSYYIQKDVSEGASITHRYYKGTENYDTIWANRGVITFDIPSVIFA